MSSDRRHNDGSHQPEADTTNASSDSLFATAFTEGTDVDKRYSVYSTGSENVFQMDDDDASHALVQTQGLMTSSAQETYSTDEPLARFDLGSETDDERNAGGTVTDVGGATAMPVPGRSTSGHVRQRHYTDSPVTSNMSPLIKAPAVSSRSLLDLPVDSMPFSSDDGVDDVDGVLSSDENVYAAGGSGDNRTMSAVRKLSGTFSTPFKKANKLYQSLGRKTRKKSQDGEAEEGGTSSSLPRSRSSSFFSQLKQKKKDKSKDDVKHSHTTSELSDLSTIPSFTSRILTYPKRECGVFLLIANFTGDLRGYHIDRVRLRKFFKDELGYFFLEFLDCTRDQLFDAVEQAKQVVKEQNANRLIVTILTHGEEKGIHTVKAGDTFLKEVEIDGAVRVTETEEIIAKCKHDVLPELRDQPKLFFVQSCSGDDVVRAAGGAPARPKPLVDQADGDDDDEKDFFYQPTLPVDADLYLASASTKYNKSFVSDTEGSWFIRALVDTFSNLHERCDVESMLHAVTLSVAEKRTAHELHDGRQVVAAQVPVRQTTLRKLCYL